MSGKPLDLHVHSSLVSMHQALQARQVSATELVKHALDRYERMRSLNALVDVNPEWSLQQAAEADQRFARGERSPLLGIPLVHKDIFVTKAFRSTASSAMLAEYRSPFDAEVVKRLSQAGMICIGKANCDEFAMGSSNENSFYGPCRNPWDPEAIPGGSSGGSAAVVAAAIVPAATGTDTGGSIRQPAALCGITGIKPTYGRISRYGMIAYASSLDQAGPMARTAEDCAWLLSAMVGHDPKDSTSLRAPNPVLVDALNTPWTAQASMSKPLAGLRMGLPEEYFGDGVAGDVRIAIQAALKIYEDLGAVCVPVRLPRTALSIPAYYVIASAEASSNLSRFDGVRYGLRVDADDIQSMYEQTRAQGFGAEVRRRILVGTYVLSHGYYDAYYLRAQRVRRLIADDFQAAFQQCDVIAGPVAPTVAWGLGEKVQDPVQMYLSDIFTLGASLAGLPAMSHPVGFGDQGRPVGLQLIGNYLAEAPLLQVAHWFQKTTDWHQQYPKHLEEQ